MGGYRHIDLGFCVVLILDSFFFLCSWQEVPHGIVPQQNGYAFDLVPSGWTYIFVRLDTHV